MFEKRIVFGDGVNVRAQGQRVFVSGNGKELSKEFKAKGFSFEASGNTLALRSKKDTKKTVSVANAIESVLRNLETGLKGEFEYKLAVVYTHFPMSVSVKAGFVEIGNFLGEKKPRRCAIIGNTKVEVKGKEVFVRGNNKDDVSQTAASIEGTARLVGKDRRVFQDGVFFVSKRFVEAGKK